MKKLKHLKLDFYSTSESIMKQLNDQGFNFEKYIVEIFQKDVDAINRIHVQGYLDDETCADIIAEIFKKISVHVDAKNVLQND